MAVFCKSYENVVNSVFFHEKFISALKMESKPMVFEKMQKTEKIFIIIISYFL